MTSPWTVHCRVAADGDTPPSAVAGIASMLLFDFGALAVSEHDLSSSAAEEELELLAGFDSEVEARRAAAGLQERLASVRCEAKADPNYQDWIDQQRDGLQPSTIGDWFIRAPWHSPSSGERPHERELVIDPGTAFGHGGHPSTRLSVELMLAALDRDSKRNYETVIDLGSGTGVIAILAAKEGRRVRAVEYDEAAVQIARTNIEQNEVSDAIALTHGDARDEIVVAANLVVANVTIDVHRMISGNYCAADRVIVAGLLCSQVAEMAGLLPEHDPKIVKTSGEWAAVDFQRSTLRAHASGR